MHRAQVHVIYNAALKPCDSDPAQASTQLFIRNYLLNADSRANLTDYTNVRPSAAPTLARCVHINFAQNTCYLHTSTLQHTLQHNWTAIVANIAPGNGLRCC